MEAAAHTYLSVHDVTASRISGLAGARYSDNLARSPQEAYHVQEGDVTISGPVDRIYDSAELITVTDPGHQRTMASISATRPRRSCGTLVHSQCPTAGHG